MSNFEMLTDPSEFLPEVLAFNLKTTVGFARNSDTLFTTLQLGCPDGTTGFSIPGDCDQPNRAMLTRLYHMSHAGINDATTIIKKPEGSEFFKRVRLIPSSHGFTFREQYDRHKQPNGQPDWENFCVTISGSANAHE